jgi:hypothetical protein
MFDPLKKEFFIEDWCKPLLVKLGFLVEMKRKDRPWCLLNLGQVFLASLLGLASFTSPTLNRRHGHCFH